MNSYLAIGDLQIALAAALILCNAGLSIALRLGMEWKIFVATVRSVVQLALIGLVLEWVFDVRRAWIVGLLCLWMILAAAMAIRGRVSRRYPGFLLDTFLAMFASSVLVTGVAVTGILAVRPWYDPQYLIPFLGMLLGNILNGITLGLDRLLADAEKERPAVEMRLACGATGWESLRPIVRASLRTGMTPILNTMTVVGIVALPGMMTGQILAGAAPGDAVRYQILILFMIAAATALGTLGAVLLGFRRLVDRHHRLRPRGWLRPTSDS